MSKTICIIQARIGSSRLPAKVMMRLGVKSVLGHTIRRMQRCKNIDAIVVATSTLDQDNIIVHEAINNGVFYFTGSEDDVLERYYRTAKFYDADKIVRITADCPFIMPDLVDKLIYESRNYDYGSNVLNRTYPKGFDCEVFSMSELERAFILAKGDEREHVTPYIIKHTMSCYSMQDIEDYSRLRITLDSKIDFADLQVYYSLIGNVFDYQQAKDVFKKLEEEND